jgi:hypothetical protein
VEAPEQGLEHLQGGVGDRVLVLACLGVAVQGTADVKISTAENSSSLNSVLRCLAWVATISVWKHEIEFGCEQVNHGFEVAD